MASPGTIGTTSEASPATTVTTPSTSSSVAIRPQSAGEPRTEAMRTAVALHRLRPPHVADVGVATEMTDEAVDFQDKIGRLHQLAVARGLCGVLLSSRANFSWLSGGRSNGIDLSRETGAGALLVGVDGRCRVLADVIEMPRLLDEALAGLDVEPVDYPWAAAVGDPAFVPRLAAG